MILMSLTEKLAKSCDATDAARRGSTSRINDERIPLAISIKKLTR